MLNALIKLREIKRASRRGRHEEVLSLARDPLVREHRTAVDAGEKARQALVEQAGGHESLGDLGESARLFRVVLQDREVPEARRGLDRVLGALEAEAESERESARGLSQIAGILDEGRGFEALQALQLRPTGSQRVAELRRRAEAQITLGEQRGKAVRDALKSGGAGSALAAITADGEVAHDSEALIGAWSATLEAVAKDRSDAIMPFRALAARPRHLLEENGGSERALQALEKRARQVLDEAVQAGDLDRLGAILGHQPLDLGLDERLARIDSGLRDLEAADEALARGEERIHEESLGRASKALGKSAAIDALEKRAKELGKDLDKLSKVDEALRAGQINTARARLMDLSERWPRHLQIEARLAELDEREAGDLDAVMRVRQAIASNDARQLEEAARLLVSLQARRADLEGLDLLERQLGRARELAPEPAPQAQAQPAAVTPPPMPERRLRFRPYSLPVAAPVDEIEEAGPTVEASSAWMLRVEEAGDWLVHPGNSLLIGAVGGGVADLPIMAAINSRHARIERRGERYRLVLEPGAEGTRNYRRIEGSVDLQHGDRLKLGRSLEMRFRQPIEGNGTAVLHLEGDFQVHGCRRVVLAAEPGRDGAVVIGPGPKAHVELGQGADRVQLFRREVGGDLFARSPHGVASGEAEPRPQVRIRPNATIRATRVAFFVEPLA